MIRYLRKNIIYGSIKLVHTHTYIYIYIYIYINMRAYIEMKERNEEERDREVVRVFESVPPGRRRKTPS